MKSNKILPILLVSGSLLLLSGCLFKVMLWPGANIMIGIGLLLELVGVPFIIRHLWKKRP